MEPDEILRKHLLDLLQGGHAHMPLKDAAADFPMDQINAYPPRVPYTPWHLLEHLRISQRDILDFILIPEYVWLKWPDDYWPARDAVATPAEWQDTLARFQEDQNSLCRLVQDPSASLTADLPHAPGYTLVREILLAADHNAYHIGEFAILRQIMATWPEKREL